MTFVTSLQDRLTSLRGELRERRESRAEYLALQRELATFRSAHEIDDLLGVIANQDGPEAQRIRDILTDNRRSTVLSGRAA